MNFGLEGSNKRILINKYWTDGVTIVVKYLDGTVEDMPYTENNINIIIHRMIAQAKNRDEILKSKNLPIGDFIFEVVVIGVEMTVFYCATELHKPIIQMMALIYAMPAFRRASNYIKSNGYKLSKSQSDEIKKYNIYLSNMNEIKKYYNDININTLDDYSLHELKKVKKKILKNKNTEK